MYAKKTHRLAMGGPLGSELSRNQGEKSVTQVHGVKLEPCPGELQLFYRPKRNFMEGSTIPNVIKIIFLMDMVNFLGMVLVMTFRYRLLLSHQVQFG